VEACCSHVLATYAKSFKYLTNVCRGGGSGGNDSDSDDDDDGDYDDMEGSDYGK
jgi:hypothetical protein